MQNICSVQIRQFQEITIFLRFQGACSHLCGLPPFVWDFPIPLLRMESCKPNTHFRSGTNSFVRKYAAPNHYSFWLQLYTEASCFPASQAFYLHKSHCLPEIILSALLE